MSFSRLGTYLLVLLLVAFIVSVALWWHVFTAALDNRRTGKKQEEDL